MKSRSRRLGLETVSRPDFECRGLVSVSGKSGKVSSRSRKKRSRLHPCFMFDPTPTPTGAPQQHDVSRDFQRFLDSAQIGLEVFNDPLFSVSLRPIAMQLFSAPCSSAASERVFSQAGLVMRPT